MLNTPRRPAASLLLQLLCCGALLICGSLGCDGGSAVETDGAAKSAPPETPPAAPVPQLDDTAWAELLNMTPEQIGQKRQMWAEQGMSPADIASKLERMSKNLSLEFKDDITSNRKPPEEIEDLVFFRGDKDDIVRVKQYLNKKNLVLVFTRGYVAERGGICPYCATQTAQLFAMRKEFEDRNTKVLIIYPGSRDHLPDFAEAVSKQGQTHFGFDEQAGREAQSLVVLDRDSTAVNLLDIAADLAYPSTFIVDKRGRVVFSYVGKEDSDRPSARALLDQIKAIEAAP